MSDDKKLNVIACTNADLSAGGYILPYDKRAYHKPTDAEHEALKCMFAAFKDLKELGWREKMYAPTDTPILVIEVGSTGIHEATRHRDGTFWAYDGDTWPSNPVLWKPVEPERDDPLHPTGRCTCCGEGTCDWCRRGEEPRDE